MMSAETNKIYNENCIDTMSRMPDSFIHLVVTSPPYDDLRDYDGYVFDFKTTAKELYRTIRHGGVVVWIVADMVKNGSETGTSFRQALKFMDIGFLLHDTMIYKKNNYSMPDPKRYWQAFEYMFVFSKNRPRVLNPISDRKNICGGQQLSGKGKTRRNPDGTLTKRTGKKIDHFGKRQNIWEYNTGHNATTNDRYAFQHPAMFPEKLASDHIVSWSNVGDLVYDPFMGSGTTAKIARSLGRKYIGSEISKKYCGICEKRLQQEIFDFET